MPLKQMCSHAGSGSCIPGSRAESCRSTRASLISGGRLNAAASRGTVDSLIAATAQVHELIVATRNTKDFQGCEVPLLNPWQYDLPESESAATVGSHVELLQADRSQER